ncbi:hypothetical protein BGW41_000652, partial [Actinomortierella wolfii]
MFKYAVAILALAAVSSAYSLITYCNHSNFSGNCLTWLGDLNRCYNVASEYNDKISSVKPGEPGITCRLYRDINCQVPGPLITGPAYNLEEQNFNDAASSFYCYFT